MTVFCGIIGKTDAGLEPLAKAVPGQREERITDYRDDEIAVSRSAHRRLQEKQPSTASDGSLIWVHGTPYGFETAAGYEPRTDFSTGDADYCADLYDEQGIEFISGLNGEFSGLVVDRKDGIAYLFTDRIGSRPLFYVRTDNALLFSSRIQAIGLHPDVTPAFDRNYLAEFFGVQKTFGTATPLDGVRKVRPASILGIDHGGSLVDEQPYWQPTYRPMDRSAAAIAERIVETLKEVLTDRLRPDLEYGVLLSGGSDSRLILGAMTELGWNPTAFHMSNWASREARTAERVARTVGAEFRTLSRGPDYHERLLETVPQFSNFVGAFDESIASGFADELDSVDVVVTGYLGDTMFGEYPLYLPMSARLIHPRFERQVDSVSEFVEQYLDRYSTPAETPDFLDAPDVADVMRHNIHRKKDAIEHHGVEYRSLRDLQLYEFFPLTNQFASANTDSIRRITGHWSPFFDRRLIDLSLTIPVRDRIRYDPINLAVDRLSPSLATIPHSGTGIPLADSTRTGPKYYLQLGASRLKQRKTEDPPPAPFLDHGPWMKEDELIRHRPFVGDAIARNTDLVEAFPFLDGSAVRECYNDHVSGANNWRALYTLITLLETPVAERIAVERSQR